MGEQQFVGIGAFSVLTGLSVPALRHYDEIDLLKPAFVDTANGYRRYRLDQVRLARLIRALRAVDLPIDSIREIIASGEHAVLQRVLTEHRDGLQEQAAIVSDYLENGIHMAAKSACRVAEVNIGVHDIELARAFYEAVFGVTFVEERHGDGPRHFMATFGSWPGDEFFLLNLTGGEHDPYRSGRANFGFLVDDLDSAYRRALAAGGTEVASPRNETGMPRTSSVCDPSGNLVHLYQNL